MDNELTNYKCGIDILFSGGKGTGYMEEYLFYDKIANDKKVVYIKDDTLISAQTNSINSVSQYVGLKYFRQIGINGLDGIPDSNDEGVIRYKVDRDFQYYYWWSDSGNNPLVPAYTGVFNFQSLEYEAGVPVVGTTGARPGFAITQKTGYYHRGIIDSFGDEWHTIIFAHDDENFLKPSGLTIEAWAGDGKIYNFVVNPKTPCMTIRTGVSGQFYTTPAKNYFIPKIFDQITYFKGDISFELKDIYQNNVFYRINSGIWHSGQNPILTQNDFLNGRNILDYYYQTGYIKTRIIYKNPNYPSANENHGLILFGNSGYLQKVKNRVGSAPYSTKWLDILNDNDDHRHTSWNNNGRKGLRIPWFTSGESGVYGPWSSTHSSFGGASFNNAFVALMTGFNYTKAGESKSYALYSKEMLIDNTRSVDAIGVEFNHNSIPTPGREHIGAGYYMVNTIIDLACSYDILIANYKNSQFPGSGLSEIDDYYIRDILAQWVNESLQWNANWIGIEPGMWGTARTVGSYLCSLVMPTYSTPYFGTCGLDGNTSIYPFTPFYNTGYTWKKYFFDADLNLDETIDNYPNATYNFNVERPHLLVNSGENYGQWAGNASYTSDGLMGHIFTLYKNLSQFNYPKETPILDQFFKFGFSGSLIGISVPSGPLRRTNISLINENNPQLALIGADTLATFGESISSEISSTFDLIWYDSTYSGVIARSDIILPKSKFINNRINGIPYMVWRFN